MTTNAELKRLAEGAEVTLDPSEALKPVYAFLAAANPARIIALVDECEKHERTIARLNRQASTSRTFWLRAARAALDGDLRELRNRVDMADAPPVDVVLSLTTGEGE